LIINLYLTIIQHIVCAYSIIVYITVLQGPLTYSTPQLPPRYISANHALYTQIKAG